MITAAWLKNVDLFSGLDETQLSVILSYSSVESFPEGKTIFNQGDEAYGLYILTEGRVTLTVKTGDKTDLLTSTIDKEGTLFGMPSLIEPFRYNVTATCLKTSKVVKIETPLVRKKMEEDLKMGVEILKKLSSIYFNRLNEMREGISKLLKVSKFKTS
jgi:CRP-like cAMP-binding protein